MKQLNKNKSRLLAMLLTFMMIFSMIPATAFAGDTDGVSGSVIPEGAPFTAITTDAGGAIKVADRGTVDYKGYSTYEGVPYYHITIPVGATEVDVTHPSSEDPFADSSYGAAYGYAAVMEGWTGSGMNFEFEEAEDGYIITLPLSGMVDTDGDWSADTEVSFVADESGNVGYAVAVERNDYSPICFFTFEYGAVEEGDDEPKLEIPLDAPFTAITTDAGDAIKAADRGTVDYKGYSTYEGVPYYHITIPAGATEVDVTHPSSEDPFADSSYGAAYGYAAEMEGWTGSGMNFEFEEAEDGYIITLPLSGMVDTDGDWSADTEVSFVADESGNVGYAVAVERNDYSPICFFTFEYSTAGGTDEPDVPAHEHTYDTGKVTKEPTCVTKGEMTYTCSDCKAGTEGYSYTEDIAIDTENGHNYDNGAITTPATCVTEGVKTFTCQNYGCAETVTGHTKTVSVPVDTSVNGHNYDEGVINPEPTCTEDGVKTFTCTNEGCSTAVANHTKTETVESEGHKRGDDTTCDVCGDVAPVQDENSIYIISNADEMLWFAKTVNNGETDIHGKLTADIELSKDWPGIGARGNEFKGAFDGQNHTITLNGSIWGVFAFVKGTNDSNWNVKNAAVIENVIVEGSSKNTPLIHSGGYIRVTNCINKADVKGDNSYVAGILGSLEYSLQYNSIKYSDVIIENCINEGDINGTSNVGGILGDSVAGTKIIACANIGNVSGSTNVGGLVGYMQEGRGTCEIRNSYNTGKVTGGSATAGIIGNMYNGVSIVNCYNAGEATYAIAGNIYNNTASITDTYYRGDICEYSVPNKTGDGKGYFAGNRGTAVTSAEMSSEVTAAALGDAFQQSCPYPVLKGQSVNDHTMDSGICTVCKQGNNMPTEYKVTFTCPEGAEIDGDTTYRAGNEYSFKVNVLDGYYADSLKVYINGTVIEAAEDGTYTVKEPNGPFYISVEGVKEYEGVVYIALPAEGDGFRVNPCEDYGTTVESGNDFKFTVSFVDGFEAGEGFTVKVNDNEIEPDNDGIYTIENILVKQTITVDGVDVVPSGKTVTVDVEITKGENEFLVANETETIVMDEQLEVPYFDLELYDYAKYYYNPYCYVDKDGNVNGQQKVGTRESAYNVVTTMHAFIYMTEVYYLGYKPKDAGTGYSDTVDSDNDGESDFDEAVSWTQGVGSSFMNLWGLGSNLNYHLNYEYPLGYPEWGSTSDQQALKDGDRISVHMIEGGASGSGFGLFVVNDDNNEYDRGEEVKDQATVKQGETIKLTHYIADQGKNYTTSFVTAGSKQLYWVVEGDESADIREWNYDEENETYNDFGNIVSENFKTDENGVIEIDTTGIEPGTYYIGAAGGFSKGSGEAGNDGFVSRGAESGPAYFKLIVVESPLSEAKANAIAEIEGYKNLDNFREAQKAELESVIDATKAAIEAAESKEAVEAVVADAKVKMDAIKTDAQLTQELNEAKAAANTTVAELKAENIKSENEYRSEQWSNLQDALAAFEQAINNATIAEEVDAALEAVETAIKAVKTRDQEIGALETALTEAIKVNEETKSALETKIAELEAALEDAAKVNVTKAELEKQIAGLKEELSKTLEENATTVEALTAEIETLAADLDKATDLSVKEKAELNAEITALKETLKQTQESNAADKKSLEEKVAGLEKSLAALQTEKAELEKQIADLEKALTDANKSNAETKSALEKQIKDLEKKLADADAASAAEKAELEKQITTLEKTLKETEAANAATVAGLEKDITALETALKDAKDVSAKDKAALEKEIAGLKETLKQTQESNAADKKAFDEKVVSLEKALAAVQAEKAELKKEIAELEQALKDANDLNAKEKAELEAKIAELEAALKELNEEQKLAAPTGLKATNIAKTGKIKISWNAVEGAEEYVVYRAKSKNGKYNKVFATTGTDYTNTNTKAGRTYFYKVKAVTGDKSVDNSDFSEVVKRICKLEKPAVTVKSPKAKQVKVSWKKVKGAKQYVVYRATVKNGKYVKVATTKKLNFTNKKLKSGKTYFYKVKAVANNANANSTFSAIKKCKAK